MRLLHRYLMNFFPVRTRMRMVTDAADAVRLLQSLRCDARGADDLLLRLVSEFEASPPSEEETMRLSVLHQSERGRGSAGEYATLTLWLSVVLFLSEARRQQPRVQVRLSLYDFGVKVSLAARNDKMSCRK